MSLKYIVETSIQDSTIIQTLIQDDTKLLMRWVGDTREQDIKDALIKLGWTPPNDMKDDE